MGAAAVHLPVLGLKNEEKPAKTHSCKDSSQFHVGTSEPPSAPAPQQREVAQEQPEILTALLAEENVLSSKGSL